MDIWGPKYLLMLIKKGSELKKMVWMAEKLSRGFPYVRWILDFGGTPIFGR